MWLYEKNLLMCCFILGFILFQLVRSLFYLTFSLTSLSFGQNKKNRKMLEKNKLFENFHENYCKKSDFTARQKNNQNNLKTCIENIILLFPSYTTSTSQKHGWKLHRSTLDKKYHSIAFDSCHWALWLVLNRKCKTWTYGIIIKSGKKVEKTEIFLMRIR